MIKKVRNFLNLLQNLKLINLLVVLFLLLAATGVAFFLKRTPNIAEAAWFDDNWLYRKAVPVTNNTSAETDVYVSVTIDTSTSGKFQADCGDLRFTKMNGQILPYYLVSGCGTASTVIHINFDTLAAGLQTVYYYYGNPSVENGFSSTDFTTQASNYSIGSTGSEEQSPGPVAYWKFDEGVGSTAYDSTQNSNNGALGAGSSAPTWQTEDMCVSGKCLKFDGSNDYIDAGGNSSLNITGTTVTYEAWIKVNETLSSGYRAVLIKATATNPWNGLWYVNASSGGLTCTNKFLFGLNGVWLTCSTTTPEIGKWYHVVARYNGSTVKIYINGIEESSANYSTPISSTTTNQYIGKRSDGYFFNGFLDEVKIYPYARSAAQIKSDYAARGSNKGVSALLGGGGDSSEAGGFSQGLVGYWKMDEASWNGTANEVIDSSGNGNHGQGIGATSPPTTAAGKFGSGGDFDGTEDYVAITNKTGFSGTAGTLSLWVKMRSSTQLLGYRTGTSNQIRIDALGGTSNVIIYDSATQLKLIAFGNINLNQWTLLTLTWDNGNLKTYLNGKDTGNTASGSGTGIWDFTLADAFKIGRGHIQNFDGQLDDVRIHNRALSPAEVRQLYNWAPGPVGYWDFNEGVGSSAYDTSGNSNNGVWSGTGTHWTTGKFGKAGSFNGSDDYVSVGDNATLDITGNITINAWVKLNTVSVDYQSIAVKRDVTATEVNYGLRTGHSSTNGRDEAQFYFYANSSWQAYETTNANLQTNTWYHITATFDGSSVKIYKNGVLINGSCINGTCNVALVADDNSLAIGRAGDVTNQYFNGLIDDLKIYNYARTQKQIVQDMNAGHPAVGSPVGSAVAHYKFDEGYGTTTNNSGVGGTVLNGTLGTGNSAPAWTNDGKFGKALSFDGTNDYVSITSNASLKPTSTLSFGGWVKLSVVLSSQPATYPLIMDKYNLAGFNGYGILLSRSSDKLYCRFGNGSAIKDVSISGASSLLGTSWNHVFCAFDGNNRKLYINGVEKASTSESFTQVQNDDNLFLGAYNEGSFSHFFSGLIDEVKIYNYALTEDEVKLDYNQGKALVMGVISSGTGNTAPATAASQEYCVPGDTATCSPPVARWDFNEGVGGTANDSSGNGNTGTLGTGNSAPTWATGKYSKALSFDGSNDCVSVSAISLTNWTVSLWAKSTTLPGVAGFFITKNNYSMDCSILSDGTIRLQTQTGADYIDSNRKITDRGWHHYTFKYDGTTIYIYIDGLLDNSANKSAVTGSGAVNIGRRQTDTSYYFNGLIDQIRIFNYARSPAQIAWDYNRGGPVGWWKFDECQGATAYDSSGIGNTGSISIGGSGVQTTIGSCGVGNTAAAWYNGASGKYNSSLDFDGTDDYVSLAALSAYNIGNDMTVSSWFKTTSSSERPIFSNRSGSGRFYYGIVSGKGFVYYNSASPAGITTTARVNDNSWHNFVYVRSGTTSFLYLDGKIDSSPTQTGYVANDGSGIRIGHDVANAIEYFPGQIDDVRIYNYALTATQVKTLYNEDSAIRFGPVTGTP